MTSRRPAGIRPRHRRVRPRWRRPVVAVAAASATLLIGLQWQTQAAPTGPADGTVTVDLDTQVGTLHGAAALGAGVDGLERGEIDRTWTPTNLHAMGDAGFGSISFRLRTELGVEAWHWNPHGTFSEGDRGYWTSDDAMPTDPGVSYGYHLPRRGNTIDQANNDGYSRIDDGRPGTYWKSNPYLDPHFTGEPEARNPQWMLVALGQTLPVDTVRHPVGRPVRDAVRVQYWTGADALFPTTRPGARWRDFPHARRDGARAATRWYASPRAGRRSQFVRILLERLLAHRGRRVPRRARRPRLRRPRASRRPRRGRPSPTIRARAVARGRP